MNITKDRREFEKQFMNTNMFAFCVKEKGGKFPFQKTGRISVPSITIGQGIKDETDLYLAIANSDVSEIVVIGHGYPTPDDIYVWRGSFDEFKQSWIGD